MTLSAADDMLHLPANDDLFWTETHWFAFAVPERKLTGYIYPVFRPNQNICSAGIYLWDDTGEANHEIVYYQNYWHLPMPDDLRNMELPGGLSITCLESQNKWQVRYDDGAELKLDLIYEGLIEPTTYACSISMDGIADTTGMGHLDQPCHVTGTIRLNGSEAEVDVYEMRDKRWVPRSDLRKLSPPASPGEPMSGSYTYGLSAGTSFVACTLGGVEQTAVRAGFLLKDGELARLVSGTRTVESEPGRPPSRMVVEGTDDIGRSFRAVGECVNRWPFQGSPGRDFAWVCGTTWVLDGEPAWGEDQSQIFARSRRQMQLPA
jgi:hypothetical protein